MPADYAWIIDKDHLAEEFDDETTEVGTTGPYEAPEDYLAILRSGKRPTGALMVHTFIMKDDDGNTYYTGRMITDASDGVSESAAYGPLGDFGMPNAGAVTVIYPHHKHLDCG